ncbi:MAG: TIGR00300 family protein [Chloroherpetonaceae bacterium]|nr:TIGR00300 family protein [Chthonomonadaceae bacterium]MDW8209066.1 TIGR00300 family protein [Chloroherpetonaceae bacterium]
MPIITAHTHRSATEKAMPSEVVSLTGHIIDSLTLSKVLDIILRDGGQYRIRRFEIGETRNDTSHAEIIVSAPDTTTLERILHQIGQHGAERAVGEAEVEPAPADGVLPAGFYVTTNLETHVRWKERWIPVEPIEMDCAIVISGNPGEETATSVPMHRVRRGDRIVVGDRGVRVTPLERLEPTDVFSFMGSEVSTERPKERIIAAIVQAMQEARDAGRRILFVGGPAIVHTGAARSLEAIIRAGWIDVLFAGNALAVHDIEQALYGTSLGVDLNTGNHRAHGHEHHLRAINTIRSIGSIRKAVEQGIVTRGILHACITCGTDFVLAGSIRDDGPLPEVITDVVQAQDAMRERVRGVGVALMVATTLHSIATGNLLPATVRTLCVDSDPNTVIKLMDRGTHQAFGLVTDCEFFLKELAARLPGVIP